jgi:amino acid transporter
MAVSHSSATGSGQLNRAVGFWGLMFFSLGSIIGSGWLLGALTAATAAGGASLISWLLAAIMLALLALVHAELGATYPLAGGTARFPHFAFGPVAGFTAGWMSWIQAVTIAPIEVLATLSYLSNWGPIEQHVTILNAKTGNLSGWGYVFATVLMLLFMVINLVGVTWLANTNSVTVVWKTAVPILTIVVLLATRFHGSNFTAGGGFAPYGAHGIFAALPLGVVFALEGFEQAIQMAGEARNPQKDISRAVLVATGIGTAIYLLLEVAFIGALDPKDLVHGWANPIGAGNFGPYATLATLAGAGWLAAILRVDAFISPAGTGLVYLATSARLTYGMGKQRSLFRVLAWVDARGIPVVSVVLAWVIGMVVFLPFPSWRSLVSLVTGASAIMYAFAPVSLHALRHRDPDRLRPYKVPGWMIVSPLAFISADMIIYWGGWEATWKLEVLIVGGFILFAINRALTPTSERDPFEWQAAIWVVPWLVGLLIISRYGRYGVANLNKIPNWWDLVVVAVFSLLIYYWAVAVAQPSEVVQREVQKDQDEFATAPQLNLAG